MKFLNYTQTNENDREKSLKICSNKQKGTYNELVNT